MIFRNHKNNQFNLTLFSAKFWFLSVAYHLIREPLFASCLESFEEPVSGLRENDLSHSNTSKYGENAAGRGNASHHMTAAVLADSIALETDAYPREGAFETEPKSSENSNACQYFKFSKRLICNGSINYAYLKAVQSEEIDYFIVENYEVESLFMKKFSRKSFETGEWYMRIPRQYQKLSGEISVEDSGLKLNVNMNLLPKKDSQGFLVKGEAFSNKLLKLSWKMSGTVSLDFIRNRTVISLKVGVGGDSRWKVQSSLTFLRRNEESEADGWRMRGCITSEDESEKQFVLYRGGVWTQLVKDECKISGKVHVQNAKLAATLTGKVSSPHKRQITIPKSAFSNMTIKNIIFKDSNLYNDFDRNSFEGVRGLKSITFTESRLEMLPRLDELFQGFTDLEEIYIEDCIAPRLKFGSLPLLKNVRKLSFKGSGPLSFDDASFTWLKNSNLTFLSLENSNVKLFVKGNSVLQSVNSTLRHLDISYSTINGDKELALVLNELSIVTLMAEGLKLRKVPTVGLSGVRKSLEFLSLRGNDFRKNLEKQMFDCILNFPLMPNLRELNLEECHINYIERGAFDGLPSLKILHLNYNNLENIQDGWAYVRPPVKYLSLRHNGFAPQVSSLGLFEPGTTMNFSKFEQLEMLDLSDGVFANIDKLISTLGGSLRNVSLRNTGLTDLPENIFESLTGVESLDLSYNQNIKAGQSFSFDLFKNLKSLNSLDLKHCRISGAAVYQGEFFQSDKSDILILENLRSLDLSVNNLKILHSKMLRAFPKLKVLNLSGNSISEWSTPKLLGDNLETVFLDENKIQTITAEMLENIKQLKQVKLGNNPFVCGSYVYEIIEIIQNQAFRDGFRRADTLNLNDFRALWQFEGNHSLPGEKLLYEAKRHGGTTRGANVQILDWSEKNYICFSWSQAKFIPFAQVVENFQEVQTEKEKRGETSLVWLVAVVVVIGLVITIAITCWKFVDIHLITRAVRNAVALTFISRDEKNPTDFKYNVFVSYCDKDRSWVVENLLPRLESRGDVKVCLHERDFQVGLSIIENILNSIDSSRNIILVLSQAFLKSQWCQYEMQLAQFRLLEKGRDQLLLIFLENIPAMRRPKTLRYLMMTKTYLEWPPNSKNTKEIDTFWHRLLNSIIIKNC